MEPNRIVDYIMEKYKNLVCEKSPMLCIFLEEKMKSMGSMIGLFKAVQNYIHAIAKKQAKHEVLFQFLFYGLIPTNFLSSIYI